MFEFHTAVRIGQMLERGLPPMGVFIETAITTPAFYTKGMPLFGYSFPVSHSLGAALLGGSKEYAEFCKEYLRPGGRS